ncbi:MAG: endo-alpha-N-acetylgalactosaminidase family protein, partial [Roseburia sp.]|nr:endo-alpha-N-acetylgalactosaminidase family protein [Roseburia sp.]
GVRATVKSDLREKSTVAEADGTFKLIGAVTGTHTLTIEAEGYETKEVTVEITDADKDIGTITLEDRLIPYHTIKTADMEVKVAQSFPQVIGYTLLDENGDPTDKTMHGQTAELDTILINGTKATLGAVTSVVSADGKTVTYTIPMTAPVAATMTAKLQVGLDDINDQTSAAAGRTLGFYITDVTYTNNDRLTNPIKTIEIPNHSLVSVRSSEPGAAVTGGVQGDSTVSSGDRTIVAADRVGKDMEATNFFAAMIYNDQLSASLASNSAYGPSDAARYCYPVRAQQEEKDGGATVSIGLGSTLWYYDYLITDAESSSKQSVASALSSTQKVIDPLEMPYAKVVIADDMNGNGKVDWQDAAIAYRETVMHIPAGGETVADSVNLRISMNFGSMAANPFLIALDNVKRVAAHTDGLGQFVLLKGYAGEGHDSNHPQYDNIGVRMGGADDLKTLMEEGEKLGATFGIHTNASEFYAEAIDDQNQVLRGSGGGLSYGWNWLDQGIGINSVYDYASGLRAARWNALYNIVKGHRFVVYVDVWGNWTSGSEGDFMTRALSDEIVSHNGWRVAHEWAWANPYESTFQHWTTDFTYGNYNEKGRLNSNVLRFILNQYKDSFPPDFASYGGAANAPLLGGPAMQGFEGWQGDGEYDLSIYNTFNQMVYTKFLQHYPVVEWTNADKAVVIPYNSGGAGGSRSNDTTSEWIPETRIRLSDGTDEIVVTRGTSGKTVTDFKLDTVQKFLAGETEYRSRVVTLNGKTIVTGAPASAGEDNTFPKSKSTLKYLIPWYWDNEGNRVATDDEKLYHWNAQGGQSTWELQDSWQNLANVMVYELSDQGRGTGKSVKVINGSITLSGIKANTGYVITRGEEKAAAPDITYGVGLHLEDPSFNIDTAKGPWKVEGTGSAIHTTNSQGIGVMKMMGEVSVSQEMTFDTADYGKSFVSYVAVDNRSNKAEARMTITDETGKVVATNYTMRSIARNYISSYYLHNGHGMEANSSYFQNMFVYFTPQAGHTYTMTLSRTAGSGNIYFDDLRTVEYGLNDYKRNESNKGNVASPVVYATDENGNATASITSLTQDFENVPQGIWPFVVGPVEGVNDNRTHLSELNGQFSQAGWDVKKLDDVIDGQWSVKSNGLSGRNSLVYQTIPQTFRFEEGKVYTVSFDYELGSAGSYVAVVGDGAYTDLDSLTVYNLGRTLVTKEVTVTQNGVTSTELRGDVPATPNVTGKVNKANVGHIEFTVVGTKGDQTWIGIYSKENAELLGTSDAAAAFGGYQDFVLDNLTIKLAPADKNELAIKLQEADTWVQDVYVAKDGDDTATAWSAFTSARTNGHTTFDDNTADSTAIANALNALIEAMNAMEKVQVSISGTVTNANNAPVAGVELTLEDSAYMPVGLKLTTGEDGTYNFVSKSGVELLPGTYHVKAQATGYNVTTTDDIVLTTAVPNKTVAISLEAEAPGAYVNDFNGGDISMMGHLEPPEGTEVEDDLWPELEWVEYNGSGALKVTFRGNDNSGGLLDCRNISNVVDKTLAFANGTVSYDVTPLTGGIRFGVTLRAGEMMNDRVCIGQQDSVGEWMGEYWQNTSDSLWTTTTTGKISVDAGATRNVRVVANGSNFQVYIDGDKVYDVTMNNVQTTAGWAGINMRYHSGSEFIIDNIRISTNETAEGTHNISGSVRSASEPIAGAAIDLLDSSGNRLDGTSTNALGEYQIKGVASGRYTLKASAPFFQEKTTNVQISGSDLTGKNFTLTLDISSLTALISEVEALNEEDYTEETWADLAEALAAAKDITTNSTIAALNTAYRDLSNARDVLEEDVVETVINFADLRNLYNEKANVENENYTNSTWQDFQDALDVAKSILTAGTADQDAIDAAKLALETAADALEKAMPVDEMDFTALEAAYAAAKDVQQGSYTADSWAKFETARDNALAILSNADGLTQADVTAAATALRSAQSALRTPSSGGGGSTSSTTTETREDGTVVTTVTNSDGSVTKTSIDPDGIKTVFDDSGRSV